MQLPIAKPALNRGQPEVRGEPALRLFDHGYQRLQQTVERWVPPHLNPLNQTGAIANLNLIVALVSGVVLLLWYSSSVHQAYDSVEAMGQGWLSGLTRSIHRYSSDGCMFFVALHAAHLTFSRRVTGARWLPWVTGLVLLALLWVTGWLGYWLVWDERGHAVALGTAAFLDVLPIFPEPFTRSFLTDEGVNSLLFFVIFFVHMLVPVCMGVALWLHISYTSRARFLTGRAMTLWVLASLVVVSLVLPATSAPPARMAEAPQAFTMDWWYLFPLVLTDRLGGGALWSVVFLVGGVGLSAPWWLRKPGETVKPATTETSKCHSCFQCFRDCPYEAISMVPRTDGRDLPFQAEVNPARCVGCGICSGSCDTLGVGLLSWLDVKDERRTIEGWLADHQGDEPFGVAFVCAESAGRGLTINGQTGSCEQLPGYYVMSVPCLGWVQAVVVDRLLERGAAHVLLAGCGPGSCSYREGVTWTKERLSGVRNPASKHEGKDSRIRVLELYAGQEATLLATAAEMRQGAAPPSAPPRGGPKAWIAGAAVAAVLTGLMWVGSDFPYRAPVAEHPVLLVTFKHLGQESEVTRRLTPDELANMPIHMRPQGEPVVHERRRADVRLRITIDGQEAVGRVLPPGGLWGDRISIAFEELDVSEGVHLVEVAIGDSADPDEWTYVESQELEFKHGQRRVVLFEREHGFSWH
jgi:coenzyme F420-reducing hydrogenase delta subunit/Pyruvate/2-oxoacid:ferredoxin oxidoreductase delta subunit